MGMADDGKEPRLSAKKDDPIAGTRCLVMEDEYLIALDLQQTLEAAGAQTVVCVAGIEEALARIAEAIPIDFAILDLRLGHAATPNLAVAEALAARGTPFLFLTGMVDGCAHIAQFTRAPLLEKPYDTEALLAAVRRLLTPG
jgi:DNA-binding response OmpR family regulator